MGKNTTLDHGIFFSLGMAGKVAATEFFLTGKIVKKLLISLLNTNVHVYGLQGKWELMS